MLSYVCLCLCDAGVHVLKFAEVAKQPLQNTKKKKIDCFFKACILNLDICEIQFSFFFLYSQAC